MSVEDSGYSKLLPKDDALEMFELLFERAGIRVPQRKLEVLFRDHWKKVSLLSHSIHAAHEAEQRAEQFRAELDEQTNLDRARSQI